MANNNKPYPSPPEPPPIQRTVQLHRNQKIGILFIFLLPILAIIGLFGETVQSAGASTSQLIIDVEYPSRFRYKMINPVRVTIENASDQTLPLVRVHFDRAYIDNFSTVTFTPDVKMVTEEAYIVELTDLQPHEMQAVSAEIQAERYWRHEGALTVVPDNGQSVSVSLDTIVFP